MFMFFLYLYTYFNSYTCYSAIIATRNDPAVGAGLKEDSLAGALRTLWILGGTGPPSLESVEAFDPSKRRHNDWISLWSGASWMYPYQRTPMGNPYISPI